MSVSARVPAGTRFDVSCGINVRDLLTVLQPLSPLLVYVSRGEGRMIFGLLVPR